MQIQGLYCFRDYFPHTKKHFAVRCLTKNGNNKAWKYLNISDGGDSIHVNYNNPIYSAFLVVTMGVGPFATRRKSDRL